MRFQLGPVARAGVAIGAVTWHSQASPSDKTEDFDTRRKRCGIVGGILIGASALGLIPKGWERYAETAGVAFLTHYSTWTVNAVSNVVVQAGGKFGETSVFSLLWAGFKHDVGIEK